MLGVMVRLVALVVFVLVVSAACGSGSTPSGGSSESSASSSSGSSCAPSGSEVAVRVTNQAIEPSSICATAAQILVIRNDSSTPIRFSVQREGGTRTVPVPVGQERSLSLSGFAPGRYPIEDTLHSSIPRSATLEVVS
jgi:hypothetical protein